MIDLKNKIKNFSERGIKDSDEEEEILKKRIISLLTLFITMVAFLWGTIYAIMDFTIVASIHYFYVIFSILSLLHFFKTKNVFFLKYSQLTIILLFPFLIMWTLGGFSSGSTLIIWAFFSPIVATIVNPKRKNHVWFYLFVFLVFASVLIDSYVNMNFKHLPSNIVKLFYFLNIVTVFGGIYFIIQKNSEERDVILMNNKEKSQRNEAIMIKAFKQLREKENKLTDLNLELQMTIGQLHSQKAELEKTLRELKEAQAQLIQSEKMASVGTLTAGVAHELNNPLNFIQAGLEALVRFFDKTFEKELSSLQPFFNVIQEGVDRASRIVKALNQFSRSQERMDEKININATIENCITILNPQIKNNINLVRNFSDKDLYISGNSGKIHQVFLNLLTNAIQAMNEKGKIEITIERKMENIIIKIKDSGIGIPQENLVKLGTPFFTTKEVGKGTGLGLSISFKIIEDHKGKISVNSELNKGTEFILTFPE